MTRDGGGSSSGSSFGSESRDTELCEFISVEVSSVLLEDMPDLFGMFKERLIEMMDNHIRTLLTELVAGQFGAHTLTFRDCRVCRAPEFFGKKDPIARMCWIMYMECDFQNIFYPESSKTRFSTYLMRDRARDW